MYENEPTFDELAELAAIEDARVVQAHSPTFWDADAAELVSADPYDHPSWEVHEALTGEDGWDDPEVDAEEILDRTVIAEHRLTPLAETPAGRREVHQVDELWTEAPTPEELLHAQVLALVPVARDGAWPAAHYLRGAAA